jgi:DNA polymerase II large subunit
MDFMFADPTMLDDLDFLYKSDTARKLMFYYQKEELKASSEAVATAEKGKSKKTAPRKSKADTAKHAADAAAAEAKMSLTIQDGTDLPLTGVGIYFLRTSTKRTLGYV